MLRVEDKYSMPFPDFYLIQNNLGAVLPLDCGMEYRISSLYFDDIYDTDLRNTIAGNPTRRKFRIRIYNDSFSTIKLEVKNKFYSRIEKLSQTITYDEMAMLIKGEPIRWSKKKEDPINLFNERILLEGLRPKVIVTYERRAYCYESGNVRITFDSNVRSSEQVELFGKEEILYKFLKDDYILEVKYDEFLPDFISQLLTIDSLRQTSFSKYQLCRGAFADCYEY